MRKHILISLCGITPAVITETIYLLRDSPPDEVIVLTTTEGYKHIVKELFTSGRWDYFLDAIDAKIKFANNHNHIRLLPTECGNAKDIADDKTSLMMANYILGTLRQFTENADTKITFSIAGGRKTMSAIGALAMGLLGRKHDDLCHVLVSPPFDNPSLQPRFYFPEQNKVHYLPDGAKYHSEDAIISLCKIPYVRQRYLFADMMNRNPGDYTDMVDLANSLIESINGIPPLELLPKVVSCRIGIHEIQLSPFEFTALWLLAIRRLAGQPELNGAIEFYEEYIDFVTIVPIDIMPTIAACRKNLIAKNAEDMRKTASSFAVKLRKELKTKDAIDYLMTSAKGKYGLKLTAKKIICPSF